MGHEREGNTLGNRETESVAGAEGGSGTSSGISSKKTEGDAEWRGSHPVLPLHCW